MIEAPKDAQNPAINQALETMDLSKWAKHLMFDMPHPLDSQKDVKLKGLNEIVDFYRTRNPKDPFNEFVFHTAELATERSIFDNSTRFDQVLRAVRLMKLSASINKDLSKMGLK